MAGEEWENYSHPADVGIRGYGATKEIAFSNAAVALTAVITEPANIQPKEMVEIECEESDLELLFVCWINALIYEMSTRRMLFARFEVELKDDKLRARAWGEQIDVSRHRPVVEVKAATFSDLKVSQRENGQWVGQCIVDV